MATFVQDGKLIDYTPGSAVAVGDVVVLNTNIIGVADNPIAANVLGALSIEGVYEFTTADTFVAGEAAYWNAAGSVMTDDNTDVYAGIVVSTVSSGTLVKVKINVGNAPAGS